MSGALPEENRGSSPAWLKKLGLAEDAVSLVILAGMIAIPLIEMAMRLAGSSVPGALRLVQVLTLWIGMSGALLATRGNQHLALSAGVNLLKGWPARVIGGFATVVAIVVTAALALGAFEAVWVKRLSTEVMAFDIPAWIPQLALPLGYGLVAIRLAWARATPKWVGLVFLAVSAALLFGLAQLDWEAKEMVGPWLAVVVVIAAVLGAPIYVALGGVALAMFWAQDVPISAVSGEALRQLEDETLPVLPLFTFTGYVLAESKASQRLVKAFRAMFGWMPGGMAIMTVVVCAFFTTFTGASGVTILALGGLLYPVLKDEGYPEKFSVGILTASGSIGLLFPPALPVIIFAVIARIPVYEMFVAGLLPGLVLVLAVTLLGVRTATKTEAVKRQSFSAAELKAGLWEAKWELAVPVVAMGAYFTGLASLLESAALTAIYTLVVEAVVYRELGPKALVRVAKDSASLIGGVLIIFGVAMGLTNYFNDAMVPQAILDWVESSIESKWVFLIALNGLLLLVGCMMDIFSALVVVAPLVIPIGEHFGVSPLQLGIIFLANLELGFLTPPVGMNLFLSSYRFGKPLGEVYRTVLPFLEVLILAVLLITYVPILTLGPVEWLFR